jgi:FkbM family methyltransferase
MSLKRLARSIVRDLLPYADLQFHTQSGLHLSIPDRGAWSTAGEVFLTRIYDPFFRHLKDVRHWVDLGCNHGFFSFGLLDYLAGPENGLPKTNVFLGDADAVCAGRVREAITRNQLDWRCEQVVIGPPGQTVSFKRNKDSLASNIFGRGHGRNCHYPTTDITARLAQEKNLFDLVKIDVEGAEKFLFDHHLNFLKRFRFVHCEWHGPFYSGKQVRGFIQQLNWRPIELRVMGVKHDPALDSSWDHPMGGILWENPNPTFYTHR